MATAPRLAARWSYAVGGLALASGAPAGALALRVLSGASMLDDLATHRFFYLYLLIATAIVFGGAGLAAGIRADRLRAARDHFHDLAEHDALTGLLNERAFWRHYRRAAEKARRYGMPIALLLIDVDFLKRINDEDGHRFGSLSLRHVARSICEVKRSDDVAARWGGDEFALLMPGAEISSAIRVGTAIVERTRGHPLDNGGHSRVVTLTVGAASADSPASIDGLFDRADRALYRGKRLGRDQCQAEVDPPQADLETTSATRQESEGVDHDDGRDHHHGECAASN